MLRVHVGVADGPAGTAGVELDDVVGADVLGGGEPVEGGGDPRDQVCAGDGQPTRIVPLPADSLANGLALDQRDGMLYVADSAVVWVSNTDKATLLRIPVLPGGAAGAGRDRRIGHTSIDDFTFSTGDTVLAALNGVSELALIRPIVLTAADGLRDLDIEGPCPHLVLGRLSEHRARVKPGHLLTMVGGGQRGERVARLIGDGRRHVDREHMLQRLAVRDVAGLSFRDGDIRHDAGAFPVRARDRVD